MKPQKRGLGSGLGALLPSESSAGVRELAIGHIRQNPRQPRTYFDEAALADLASSIREHGIIQPIIVSQRDQGVYELVAGERRWRAAQLANLATVPVIVRETTPQQLLELALIENVQRADLNPLEEALAYQSLKEQFHLTDAQIAERVGKNSRVTVTNARRLLELPQQAHDALIKGAISAGHGRALLKLADEPQRLAALDAVIADELSVRESERLGDLAGEFGGDVDRAVAAIRRQRASRAGTQQKSTVEQEKAPSAETASVADDREMARSLERLIGTPVRAARKGAQLHLTIEFHSDEKLLEFFERLAL